MTAPSWAEAKRQEMEAHLQWQQTRQPPDAIYEGYQKWQAARHASDVALVRKTTLKVFQHLRDTGWISFDASDFDPEAVLAEIEKEEG